MAKFKLGLGAHITLWALVLASILLYFLSKQIPQESIQNFVASAGPWAPIVYILLHQASYVIAPISGFPFLLVGFLLFGKTTVIYNLIVAILGSSINFLIAKKWGRSVVKKLAGNEALGEIDKFAREYGLGMLFILRLFLIGLGDYISYGYGLTPIKFHKFITVSTIAMIPAYTFWYIVALETGNIEQFLGLNLVLTFAASGIFIIGHYFLKRLRKTKN